MAGVESEVFAGSEGGGDFGDAAWGRVLGAFCGGGGENVFYVDRG